MPATTELSIGFEGLRRPVRLGTGDRPVPLVIEVRGLVRTSQSAGPLPSAPDLLRVADQAMEGATSVESLVGAIARRLLEGAAGCDRAEAGLAGTYFLERTIPSGRGSLEPYGVTARAVAERGERDGRRVRVVRTEVGVEVVGISACPCAMEVVRELMGAPPGQPMPTHSQRNRTTIRLDAPAADGIDIDALIQLAEESQSAPTFALLKRGDEGRLVYDAHRQPRFVEDVVREVLHRLVARLPSLPDDTHVTVRSVSEESIHKHDAFAERQATLGELRSATRKAGPVRGG